MIDKKCILDNNKNCDNCGDCEVCDLDSKKICDNCGKCLGESDFETRALMVDEIIEDPEELETDIEVIEITGEEEDETDRFVLIDDIEGLTELLENKNHSEKYTVEEFPGLIRFKKNE